MADNNIIESLDFNSSIRSAGMDYSPKTILLRLNPSATTVPNLNHHAILNKPVGASQDTYSTTHRIIEDVTPAILAIPIQAPHPVITVFQYITPVAIIGIRILLMIVRYPLCSFQGNFVTKDTVHQPRNHEGAPI